MSVDPGPPLLSTQAERAQCYIERLVELGMPTGACQIPLGDKQPVMVDGAQILAACVAVLNRRDLSSFPPELRIGGKELWAAWRRYPLGETLEVLGRMGRREFTTVKSLGEGFETYARLLDELQRYDDGLAPELLHWCRELLGAWTFTAAEAGRHLRLGCAGQPIAAPAPSGEPSRLLGRILAAYRRPAPSGGPIWCIVPALEVVRQRRNSAGQRGTADCGMLVGSGGTPQPGRTTLLRLPRRVAQSTATLGVCAVGRGDITAEVASTTIALYDGGMDAAAALKAAQLISV